MEGSRISHYEITRLLGRGGMGEVYEARDLDLDRTVALKFVAAELAAEGASLKRFEQEATSAARLSHPHIARVFAFHRDERRPFIDMELVPGGSLRQRIEAGSLPLGEALAIARDVAAALAHAHRKDIVHRDIKPENLMFDEEGEVKVTDFGLARAVDAARLTMTGVAVGSASYMAPEAIRGVVGPPADVFALGIVLHEMLTGALPFAGENAMALMYSIANTEPRRLREARADVPEAVEALVLRLLEKDPARRPEAAEVMRALAALTGTGTPQDSGVLEPTVERVPPAPAPLPVPVAERALMAPRRGGRAARMTLFAVALLVIAGLVVIGGALVRRRAAHATDEARRLGDAGFAMLNRGQRDSAEVMLRAALARAPRFAPALINLGRVWHERGVDARAESLYALVLRDRSASPRDQAYALSATADLDLAAAAWPAAVDGLEQAFALDSTTANAYNDLGYALVMAGRAADAQALLARGAARFPGVAALHKNGALAALALGDVPAARDAAARATELAPGWAPALAVRARVRAALGDLAGARADWTAMLAGRDAAPALIEQTASDLAARGVPVAVPGR